MRPTAEVIASIHKDNMRLAYRTVMLNLYALAMAFCIALLVFALSKITAAPPPIEAFTTNRNGVYERITPLVNPSVTEEQAIGWVKGAVIDLMSIRFDRYEEQIASREKYFYGDGFGKYRDNINTNVVPVIRDELLIVTAINNGSPILIRKQTISGVVQRTYQISMLQTTQGPTSDRKTERRVVVVTIAEATRDKSIRGLQIKRFYVKG